MGEHIQTFIFVVALTLDARELVWMPWDGAENAFSRHASPQALCAAMQRPHGLVKARIRYT